MTDCPDAIVTAKQCPQTLTASLCTPGVVSKVCAVELSASIGDPLAAAVITPLPQSAGQFDPVFTQPYSELLTATDGQTTFTLMRVPQRPNASQLFVNGSKAIFNQHFTIVGNTLTWIASDMVLGVNDRIEVIYG